MRLLEGLDCITINLDPGAEFIPYEPDIDIRDWVKVSEVMEDYGLGPNGAQVVCADLMALHVKELVEAVDGFKTPYVLIDTPGQIELFAFRQSSQVIIDQLGQDDSFLVYLSDPLLVKSPTGFVSSLMLCATVHFRFAMPIRQRLGEIRHAERGGPGTGQGMVEGARVIERGADGRQGPFTECRSRWNCSRRWRASACTIQLHRSPPSSKKGWKTSTMPSSNPTRVERTLSSN